MKRFGLSWLLLLLALVAAVPGFAQLPKLDAFLKGLTQEGTFYGSVLVVRGGATAFQGDYGFRDEAQTQKNDPASVYYAPGVDETILATLVLMAQERGLVALDASIGTYLPEFRDKPAPRVRDLLCHAAGLPVFRLNDGKHAWPGTLTLAALAAGAAERPLLGTPGVRYDWEYKDYDLLGYILEIVTGKPFPSMLAEWIAEPLKLQQTGAGLAPTGQEFAWSGGSASFQESLALWKGGYQPARCMYTSVADLDRFFVALASGQLITPKSYRAMQTALVQDGQDGIGLGLAIAPSGQIWNAGHNSGGYRGLISCDPRYQLRIIMLCNRWMPVSGSGLGKVVLPEIYAALGLRE